MNVLVLTPDAVGSTLLQRLITIYMQFHEFDRPVINLHELTNGLHRYHSSDFNREVLGKHPDKWGYYQSLSEIRDLLASVDHYKTSRLALYHIQQRRDTIDQQVPFYQYLNQNFFIICTRRRNLFEHALSWGLNKITKKINVYHHQEKINTFIDMYRDPIDISIDSLIHSLDSYKNYLTWAEDCFMIGSYFYYEDHLNDIEKYILNLPIFSSQPKKITWAQTYGMEFSDYNRCHYYSSDLGAVALEAPQRLPELTYAHSNPSGQNGNNQNLVEHLPRRQKDYFMVHQSRYQTVQHSIDQMVNLGIMMGPLPIKKQTLAEKRMIVKNFDQCLETYNSWAKLNTHIATEINQADLESSMAHDSFTWSVPDQPTKSPTDRLSIEMS